MYLLFSQSVRVYSMHGDNYVSVNSPPQKKFKLISIKFGFGYYSYVTPVVTNTKQEVRQLVTINDTTLLKRVSANPQGTLYSNDHIASVCSMTIQTH